MAEIPGLDADVFFGDVSRGPVDWRKKLPAVPIEDEDDDAISEAERAEVVRLLGFDPREYEAGKP